MQDSKQEVERIRRVADQLCSCHAMLRDHFGRLSFYLDIGLLLMTAWLTVIALIDPKFLPWIVPYWIDAAFGIGLLGFFTFCGVLFQFKSDWRGRSEAHGRTCGMYAEVKREAGYILATSKKIEPRDFQRLAVRYDMASDTGVSVPDKLFLRLKKKHLQKVAISKLLDEKPGLSIILTKVKMFFCDNRL